MIDAINVLGIGVSAINMDLAVGTIGEWIRKREPHYVCITGVHGVMESQRDKKLKQIHNMAGMVTPDGMPLAWLLKLSGHGHADRVSGVDLMFALFEMSDKRDYTHYLYGASEDALARLQANLTRQFPAARIVGAISPPFRSLTEEEDKDITKRINESGADIVWVGLSTPKQERWMAAHRDRLDAPGLIGVGAAFDFHAGLVRRAPRFIQRSGFEWLFRLAMEPRRLWKRYLTNNPQFVLLLLAQTIGLKRYKAVCQSDHSAVLPSERNVDNG